VSKWDDYGGAVFCIAFLVIFSGAMCIINEDMKHTPIAARNTAEYADGYDNGYNAYPNVTVYNELKSIDLRFGYDNEMIGYCEGFERAKHDDISKRFNEEN
jgi:hypothetical protein